MEHEPITKNQKSRARFRELKEKYGPKPKENIAHKMLHTLRKEGIKEHEHPYWEGEK